MQNSICVPVNSGDDALASGTVGAGSLVDRCGGHFGLLYPIYYDAFNNTQCIVCSNKLFLIYHVKYILTGAASKSGLKPKAET